MSSGGTSSKTSPSAVDRAKASVIKGIAPGLEQYLKGGLANVAGGPQITTREWQDIATQFDQIKALSGSLGISPGDPRLSRAWQTLTGNLTSPKQLPPEMLHMLATVFGTPVNIQGNTTQSTKPGTLDYVNSWAQHGLAQASLLAASSGGCHVAEVLFGAFSELTFNARYYVHATDNWFTRLYRKNSVKWANFITKYPFIQPFIRPIWLYMANRGRQLRWALPQ